MERKSGKKEKLNKENTKDVKTPAKKELKYPRGVPFIVGNKFCQSFNYYGMRTILVLYLTKELGYSDNNTTVIFHTLTMLEYFMCVPGAMMGDSKFGKFKTIFSLTCVYALGSALVTSTSVSYLNLPRAETTIIGLILIAIGAGAINPCVSAFGGDQFKLPEQAKQAAQFFSVFYFAINCGSLISIVIAPILREDIHCLGQESCYPLAFGIPTIMICVSVLIFFIGYPFYNIKSSDGDVMVKVFKAIRTAISVRWNSKKNDKPKDHWLDYAEKKYDRQLLNDIKVLLKVLVLYIPVPVFWALFDQQGSRWTLQAANMNGSLGPFNIKPEHMQLVNPFLILTLIPLYEAFIYPLLAKIGIRSPLQKLFLGGIFAGIAFVFSGLVELQIESTQLSDGKIHLAWQLPQYIMMTLGEVMFSVTGLEFSYSEAPESLKTVLQAAWTLTGAFGNIIVIIIAEAKFFNSQAHEFFLFAGLMFIDMLIFSILAYLYKPVKSESKIKNKKN